MTIFFVSIALTLASGYVQLALLGFGMLMAICPILWFGYFAIWKPDYLRSEDYQNKKDALGILGAKGHLIEVKGEDLARIANPEVKEEA